MQSLLAALHAQGAAASTQSVSSDSSGSAGTTSISASGARPNPASDLQSLIQELTASGSQSAASSSGSSSTDAASSGSNTSDSTLTNLEQSFQKLVSATGAKDGSTTALNNFLSALANDMNDASSTGNFVNTRA
jgi:hypothetical protein